MMGLRNQSSGAQSAQRQATSQFLMVFNTKKQEILYILLLDAIGCYWHGVLPCTSCRIQTLNSLEALDALKYTGLEEHNA